MAIKCVIAGVGGSHDTTVATAIKDNSSLTDAQIAQRGVEDFSATLAYADGVGAVMVVRSTDGVGGFTDEAQGYYPDIQCFFPLGSNTYAEMTALSSIPVIVTSGAGNSTATANQTGYGAGLEFWDRETYGNASAESSYSNGVVAGKLYTIKTTLNCSWWEARYRARLTASNLGVWNKYDGYGRIDVQRAIEDRRYVIPDPYAEAETTSAQPKPGHLDSLRGVKIGSRYLPDLIK